MTHADDHSPHHADDELLAALALGETDEVDSAVRRHVAGCLTCRRQVEQLAGFAAVTRSSSEPLVAPARSVWAGIEAAIAEPASAPVEEPVRRTPSSGSSRRRVPAWLVAAAAAVALVAGTTVGWLATRDDGRDAEVVATTRLSDVADGSDLGTADVVQVPGRTTLQVRLTSASPTGDTLREVWLLNEDGRRMVSLGLMPSGDDGSFTLPQRLLGQGYRIVDVSLEPDDGDPTHSGDSVARGTLADG